MVQSYYCNNCRCDTQNIETIVTLDVTKWRYVNCIRCRYVKRIEAVENIRGGQNNAPKLTTTG